MAMAESLSPKGRSKSSGSLGRTASGTLRTTGQTALANSAGVMGESLAAPKLPQYLAVNKLTRRRKLAASTGNLHGLMAEDYNQLSCPMPKMFGNEKYGFSLIDIEDPRYLKECAQMSKRLIRLQYDVQIIDFEWRKTYKNLLAAEHRLNTLGEPMPMNRTYNVENHAEATKGSLKAKVDEAKVYLLQLQEQKNLYEQEILGVYEECAKIKLFLKKETDLEDLRRSMESKTRGAVSEATFYRKFNTKSQHPKVTGVTRSIIDLSEV